MSLEASREASPEPEPPEFSACPGCGAVLATGPVPDVPHPGASPACARLFEVTLRGLRDGGDAAAASCARLADDAYDAQHPVAGDPERLRTALDRLGVDAPTAGRPAAWQMTVGDVAADLDVVDLPALVESWARTVVADWTTVSALRA
jgi:Family of unknown function (DUF5946)